MDAPLDPQSSDQQSEPAAHLGLLPSTIVRIVDFCTRYPWAVIIFAAIVSSSAAIFAVRNFAINTDVNRLISADVPWRRHEIAFDKAFPQRADLILAVVQARTPENAKQATNALTKRLLEHGDLFRMVHQPGGGEYFDRNGLLYLPTEELARTTEQLMRAQPILGALTADPSLRGATEALSFGVMGVQARQFNLDDLTRPLTMLADTLDVVLARHPASFSWLVLLKGKPAEPRELRRLIEVHPVLDFSALEPGKVATDAIRKAAVDLKLASEFGASVRLTGPIPMADEEFSTLRGGAFTDVLLTIATVVAILFLALRSWRIILACFLALMTGLAVTAALGLMMVGALNLISIAFAVLFIGLGVDFGIQFAVRYRAERHERDELFAALQATGATVGAQLTLAAAAVTAAFFSFLPTDYRGVSELGLIAGVGMVIAFTTSITLLPALLYLLNPPGEPHPLGYKALAPVDRFMERHRVPIVVVTALVALAGSPLLYFMRFDFNPVNLRSPKVESVATFLELKRDTDTGMNAIAILAPSLAEADAIAARVAKLPEVSRTMTLDSFVPDAQNEKLALIRQAAAALNPTINPPRLAPAPSDAENIRALTLTADRLKQVANEEKGPGATAARRLSRILAQLASADPTVRANAETALIPPLRSALDDLRNGLRAEPVTLKSLPPALTSDWIAPDGRARVEVLPTGDTNDNEVLRKFATAVLAVEPGATGAPVSLLGAGRTVVRAFIEAGLLALASIALLLWITLRRFGDVLLTLVPLLLAGVVTLEICVIIGLPLNFANIIALPLLLGVGVAFKIYYIMAWRAGQTNLLQSSLTRAVFFSAMTTATAFGSLWMSSHPGTSSMGKLLALSLLCTLAAAVLFQPALMGPPRDKTSA